MAQFKISERKAKNMVTLSNKKFFMKHKAEEWILNNKPSLSINDIKDAFPKANTTDINVLKELIKTKTT